MKYCLAVLAEVDAILRGSGRVLIASDFDGTLCPIAPTPSEVAVAPATLEILRRAAACPRLSLAVISGRELSDIRRRVPLEIVFAGNHGLEVSGRGIDFEHEGARQLRASLTGACEALGAVLREWPAAWIEDKGLSATLHFRQVQPHHDHALLFAARRALSAGGSQLALRVGNRALELRPKVPWEKGHALEYIREKAGPFEGCICLGDDTTDESMFRANRDQLNIRIGRSARTAATHYLQDPGEVTILLSHIVDIAGSAPRPAGYAASAAAALGFNECGTLAEG